MFWAGGRGVVSSLHLYAAGTPADQQQWLCLWQWQPGRVFIGLVWCVVHKLHSCGCGAVTGEQEGEGRSRCMRGSPRKRELGCVWALGTTTVPAVM